MNEPSDSQHNSGHRAIPDRFLGCLLGLAIGDALGMPVEGMHSAQIRNLYGWINTYLPRQLHDGTEIEAAGEITDDTEMTLCLVESLVSTGGLVDPDNTGMRFLRLYQSDSRRFMGRTTRQSLERADKTGAFQSGVGDERAAGNGAAMRVAPVGLVHSVGRFNYQVFVREVMRAGLITHSNPEAINGAIAMAYGVRVLTAGDVPIEILFDEVCSFIDEDRVAARLRLAASLVHPELSIQQHLDHLEQIGTSGYVAESVAAAFYCAVAAQGEFRRGVELAVNAGGDTDTVASMTGALLGSALGAREIPLDFVEGLNSRAYILVAAPSLYETAMQRAGLYVRLHHR
jgi:ADP-ribosyl-[dinitrogen reductase] hydrolase